MRHLLTLFFAATILISAAQAPELELESFATGFTQPLDVQHAGDDRLFVVERAGVIKVIEDGQVLATPFLDIQDVVYDNEGEQGLLGLAFHPNYQTNGYFYVHYINNLQNTYICRFTVSSDPNVANRSSETLIFSVDQPDWNHNGGAITFGPDGYLYFALGDGGGWRDTYDHGQNTTTILGGIGRIDVDGGFPYAIPNDNPFANEPNDGRTLYHWGLRNPWKFSFDAETGDMWIGDVGQDGWEEFNYISASTGPSNFGWPCREGANTPSWQTDCGTDPSFVEPVFEFTHAQGANSGIGGYVYRGSRWNRMDGYYVFSDLAKGGLYTLFPNGSGGWTDTDHGNTNGASQYVSFGQDQDNELYVVSYFPGAIYKVLDGGCKDFVPTVQATTGENPTLTVPDAVAQEWYRVGEENILSTESTLSNIFSSGQYYAYAENSAGCKWYSDTVQVTITSLQEMEESAYEVFPNPSTNNFQVEGPTSFNARLLDIKGTELDARSEVSSWTFGSELKAGQYILEISTPEGTINKQIVKK